jgi:hypothetical protein
LAASPVAHVEDAGGSTGSTIEAGSTRPAEDARVEDRSSAPGNGAEGGDGSGDRAVLTDSALDAGDGDAPTGNLIVGGDFSDGASQWGVAVDFNPLDSGVTNNAANGQLCVTLGPDASATLGWPRVLAEALTLSPGAYALSYEISSSVPLEVEARFGVDIAPYNDLNFDAFEMPGTALETFSTTFTLAAEEKSAGLAFNFPAGTTVTTTATVCFANVSLVLLGTTTD